MSTRSLVVDPLDLALTLGPLGHGRADPTVRLHAREVWRALRTGEGPATVRLRLDGAALEAEAWGPGAEAALDDLPGLVGCDDRPEDLVGGHPVIDRLVTELRGLRIGRTGAVVAAAVDAVLRSRVTAFEASRSHHQIVTSLGEPAPGPGGLLVPPSPAVLAALPAWSFHLLGVETGRADVIRRICARRSGLDGLGRASSELVGARLLDIPGVSPAIAAEAVAVATGDPDVVPLGDPYLPGLVGRQLAGEPDADDERMLGLLAPWAGQRGRVIRLLRTGEMRRRGRIAAGP